MARRRYISTTTSTDKTVNKLATKHGDFAALLYVLMIPHAEDDGTLTGDPEELLAVVLPMRRDKDESDVAEALAAMSALGLITWDRERDLILFPAESFYRYQTYIKPVNRRGFTTDGTEEVKQSAQDSEQQRGTPQNAASLPLPHSLPLPLPVSVVQTQDSNQHFPPAEQGGARLPESAPIPENIPKASPHSKVVVRNSKWEWLRRVRSDIAPLAEIFEHEFYCNYPRKESPEAAFKAFLKLKDRWSPGLKVEIMAGLQRYRASPQWRDPTKIPHPATWITQRRWEGDPPDEGPPGPSRNGTGYHPPPVGSTAKSTMYPEFRPEDD